MAFRRSDFDVLRVVCTVSIFLFHCFCIFAVSNFYISNAQTSPVLAVLIYLMLIWMLPVFFIISGRVTYQALGRTPAWEMVKTRFLRYMVPFLVGVFSFCAIIVYLTRVFYHQYSGSLLSFYVNEYFHGLYGFGGNFSFLGNHLWYLFYLFSFTVVLLLFFWLVPWRGKKEKALKALSIFQKPGALFLLSIPVILTTQVNFIDPNVLGRDGTGGWNVLTHFVFFSLGVLFAYDVRFDEIIDRHWKVSAVLAVPLLATYAWLLTDIPHYESVLSWLKAILLGLTAFTTFIAIFGFSHRYITRAPRHIAAFNEAVLPFYILHFPIVIIYGFFIVQLDLGLFLKLGLVIALSFVTIIACYLVIRRVRVLRFLFGMKPLKKKDAEGEI